ncbi:MAG: iron-sulfur cluster-binding domain-containing protein [Actinoplanes sp.]
MRRAYSASSAPGSSRLEVTVKHVDGGRFTTHVHRTLRAGDRLAVRGPSGSFHTEAQPPEQIVLVAAGSGITPMMSMIRARRGRVALLYSSRSEQEIIFAGELARLAQDDPDRLSVTHVLTGRDGRLDAGLAAGLPMPYSCTVGNCGDCMVRLRTGEVTQNEPNCLTPQQKADGYVLACVGCPLSKVTLDVTES